MRTRCDADYVLPIEYGPPPTAGEGIGIGRLVRRISGFPNLINYLAYSPDERYLAWSLRGKNGVRLFQAASGCETGQDGDYGDASYTADFNRDGRRIEMGFNDTTAAKV